MSETSTSRRTRPVSKIEKTNAAAEETFVHSLPFLALGRVGKQGVPAVTLATYDCADSEDQRMRVQEIFKKLLAAGQKKLTAGQKTRLQWNEGSVCCMRDNGGTLLYCLITANMDYPERFAYQLLTDLHQHVLGVTEAFQPDAVEYSLHEALQGPMRDLVKRYENPNSPELEAAMSKIIVTKQRMQSGINQMGANRQEVSDLEASTSVLASQSFALQGAGRDLHNRLWWQNTKLMSALACVIIVVVVLMIWHFFPRGSEETS